MPGGENKNPLLADREWLRKRYEDDALSVAEIAAEAGADVSTVYLWLARHEIPRLGAHNISAKALRNLLSKDYTVAEIARRFGVDRAVIYDRLYRLRLRTVELRGDPEKLRKWYRSGESVRDIARKLGVSPRTATRQLLAAGVQLRSPGRRKAG